MIVSVIAAPGKPIFRSLLAKLTYKNSHCGEWTVTADMTLSCMMCGERLPGMSKDHNEVYKMEMYISNPWY